MNPDERIKAPRVVIFSVRLPKIALPNAFGVQSKAYDMVDDGEKAILLEDGSPILLEGGGKLLLEQQKVKVWRQKRAGK